MTGPSDASVRADPAPRVTLARCEDYDRDRVGRALEEVLAPFGGLGAFVRRGTRVLLKPNLVAGYACERAVNTHPALVGALGERLADLGATILLGDSPGVGSARSVAARCGILAELERVGGRVVEFTLAPARETTGTQARPGLRDMAREISEADCLINLPKFKTHVFAGLTLGVKNCFGAVVGPRKFQWHYRAGHDERGFSRMLLEVYRACAPALTILDAVVGMEGHGPTGGTPAKLGFLAAATDALALDTVGARIAGLDPLELGVLAEAVRDEAAPPAWLEPEVVGADWRELCPESFALPERRAYNTMVPSRLGRLVRRFVVAWPRVRREACTACGVCARICPAEAIATLAGSPEIDRERCIRCYCCHELCPHQAMELRRPLPGRIVERLFLRRGRTR